MFSSRTPADLAPNRLSQLVAELRAAGRPLCDLTVTNPTAVGIEIPRDGRLARALAAGADGPYEPDPRGLRSARCAVADFLAARGAAVEPEHVFLTASTSEAYGFLFKLLCQPGDQVLVPRPSYPLFEHLAALEAVAAPSYRLGPAPEFALDPDRVEVEIEPRTRAVVVVTPNNPTGQVAGAAALAELSGLCRDRGLALVSDEVFAWYPAAPGAAPAPSALAADPGGGGALRFALGGLSKSCGLPQVKLAWLALAGPPALRDQAAERLEHVADAYLSVSGPVMRALPDLLALGRTVRDAIRARVAEGRARVARALAGATRVRALPGAAGWSQVLALDPSVDEEAMVLEMARERGVLLQPGYFFDFDRGAHAVVSLLSPPDHLERGLVELRDWSQAAGG